ncbi:sulfurtransferase complex subunit TusD [uncultured Oceanicoccus sp.]|uniref:sulfurtransferase complex subunit TusD n=1 Tax=uncultured Oceanicoccus sp. TaxID=1706381 RepID=UPI0030D71B4B
MRFSLLILGAPYSSQSVSTALRFAQAAVNAGHSFYRIFFYHDAVNSGNKLITPPQDENDIPLQWQNLANDHDIDLVVCIASALKRGVLDAKEADRYEKNTYNLNNGFKISGLGQLIDASIESDRLITFGP